jgi:NADPH-dependent glutamate synthase beta subunit-like oxidoreductase/coenzyme F420-reducing hydrogenase delta subunit/Pyruvate/2-oxoacid:ferredoxin oxidoreductase delta subunit
MGKAAGSSAAGHKTAARRTAGSRTAGSSAADSLAALLAEEEVTLRFPGSDLDPYTLRRVNTSQCKVACPLGTDVKGYVALIAAGKYERSLDLIKETNPFPAICGRVCMHPCEPECRRGEVDSAVSIRALKRFVADYELRHPPDRTAPVSAGRKVGEKKVAIVGSGPTGLTAASDLARRGFAVTVFEALPVAGGMLSVGIPPFRLPRDVIQAEIAAIRDQGVTIRTGKRIRDPRGLLRRGYQAVLLATGAHRGLGLNIPGEQLTGCQDALSFLRQVHLGWAGEPGRKVVVIGGGYAALDAARTAVRLGSRQVEVIYRRSRDELPYPDLAREAEREGIKLHVHTAPVRIRERQGRVAGVACVRTRSGPPDGVGRREPVVQHGSRFVLSADRVIFSVHQEPDLSYLTGNHGLEISPWNTLVVDPDSLATNRKGLFAAGDAVSGPKSVIEAIAMGHQAAASIDRFIRGRRSDEKKAGPGEFQSEVVIEDWVPEERSRMRTVRVSSRSWDGHFDEVVLPPSEDRARDEAQRCLMCGPCSECEECIASCPKKLMALTVPGGKGREVLVRIPWLAERFPETGGPWEVVVEGPGGRELPALASAVVCDVWEELCRGCAECVEVCEYEARKMVSRPDGVVISQVDRSICRGCGACVNVCPTGASVVGHFTDDRITQALESMLAGRSGKKAAGPRVVVLACNWSAYPSLQGRTFNFPVDLHVIRVMCLGSISPGLILRAFEAGADGILMLGCPPEKCHYTFGDRVAETQLEMSRRLMNTLGIEKNRLRLERLSSDEGSGLERIVRRFARQTGALGPNPWSR